MRTVCLPGLARRPCLAPLRAASLWVALASLSACSDDPAARPPDAADTAPSDADAAADTVEVRELTLGPDGGVQLHVSLEASGALTLRRSATSVPVTIRPAGFILGVVPALDPTRAYDPWYLEPDAFLAELYVPHDLVWHAARAFGPLAPARAGDAATVALDFGPFGRGTVEILLGADGRFDLHWTAPDAGAGGVPAFFRLELDVSPEERFYGLGEHFDQVEQRGQRRAMQLEGARLESAYNEAHVPIPLLVGTSAWGLYVDSARPGFFDVAATAPDKVRVTYGLGTDHVAGLRFHLFAADHPLDIPRFYHDLTGLPGQVAPWALGPWLWRDEVDDQAAVEADLDLIRALDLATTGYWIDRPYATAVNSFDFAAADYPNPAAMMARAEGLGYAMALWHTPYLDPDDPGTAAAHDAALAAGWFPPEMGTALGPWGPPLDFTHPAAAAYWRQQLGAYRDLGVRGYKLDYAEEVIVGVADVRFPWRFFDGSDELTMHRRYQLGYHAAYRAVLPDAGGFLLVRAAVAGDQVHGLIVWPGDIDANMARHGEAVPKGDGDGTYLAVGGLPAAVIAGSSLGASGFPLFAADTGGYRHAPPDRETYLRWIAQSALSPVMQTGTNANDMPWSLGPAHADDPELLDHYRRFARLHLRLWPYLWAHVQATRAPLEPGGPRGRPIQRPLGLAHPELGLHPDDVYLLGDDLLVAPVVTPGAVERAVPLPAGVWVDWWTGARHAGPTTVTVPAPLTGLPLFVRGGSPIPLLRPDIDTLLPAPSDATLVTPTTAGAQLWIRLAPGPDGRFVLTDGTTVEQAVGTSERLTVTIARGPDHATGAVVLEVFGAGPAAAPATPFTAVADPAAFTGAPGTWARDPSLAGGTLWVALPQTVDAVTISLAP